MHRIYKIYIIFVILIFCLLSSFIYVNEAFDGAVKPNNDTNKKQDYKLGEGYIISLNDELFNKAKENLSPFFSFPLHKFDAIQGSSLRSFNPNLMTIGAYRSILYDTKRRVHADLGSFNAVGCASSHATLWKKIKPGEGMFVFESDAILKENPIPYVEEFLKTDKPHMLLFGPISKSKVTATPKIKKVNYHFFGTHGYYITYEGAQLLLKYFYPIEQQIDSYISDFIMIDSVNDKDVHFGINVYIINPGICYQFNDEGSSIQTKVVEPQ